MMGFICASSHVLCACVLEREREKKGALPAHLELFDASARATWGVIWWNNGLLLLLIFFPPILLSSFLLPRWPVRKSITRVIESLLRPEHNTNPHAFRTLERICEWFRHTICKCSCCMWRYIKRDYHPNWSCFVHVKFRITFRLRVAVFKIDSFQEKRNALVKCLHDLVLVLCVRSWPVWPFWHCAMLRGVILRMIFCLRR